MSNVGLKEACISVLSKLKQMECVISNPRFQGELGSFQDRLEDNEFRIAVVGEFSAGKSTFINAILGEDILLHGTTETTATITRIVNVDRDDPRSHTGVVFMSDGSKVPLDDFDRERMVGFTTTDKTQRDVVNDVDWVEMYMPVLNAKHKIVLVDTPGLNGTADRHREKTIELVQKAHACIYVMHKKGLSESEQMFLEFLSRFQKCFIFVQNFIDDLSASEGETPETVMKKQRDILDKTVFTDAAGDVRYMMCGVSALQELAAKDQSIHRLYDTDNRDLTPEDRKRCHKASRFDTFREMLGQVFNDSTIDRIQYGDTARTMLQWLDSCMESLRGTKENMTEIYQMSREAKRVNKLETLKQRVLNNQDRQRRHLEGLVGTECDRIAKDTTEDLDQRMHQVECQFSQKIDGHKSWEKLNQWTQDHMPNELYSQIAEEIDQTSRKATLEIQNLYQMLMQRIEEYTGKIEVERDFDGIQLTESEKKPVLFEQDDSLKEDQEKINLLKKEAEDKERQAACLSSQIRDTDNERAQVAEQKVSRERECEKCLSDMGSRPEVEYNWVRKTHYKNHGGLGIVDALFGPKVITTWDKVPDSSKQLQWDNRRKTLENRFTEEIQQITRNLNALQRKQNSLEMDKKAAEEEGEALRNRVLQKEKLLRVEREVLLQKQEKAAADYLVQYKADLKKQLHLYLWEGDEAVLKKLNRQRKENIDTIAERMKETVLSQFDYMIQNKLKALEQAKEEACPKLLGQVQELAQAETCLAQMSIMLKEKLK